MTKHNPSSHKKSQSIPLSHIMTTHNLSSQRPKNMPLPYNYHDCTQSIKWRVKKHAVILKRNKIHPVTKHAVILYIDEIQSVQSQVTNNPSRHNSQSVQSSYDKMHKSQSKLLYYDKTQSIQSQVTKHAVIIHETLHPATKHAVTLYHDETQSIHSLVIKHSAILYHDET